MKPRFLSFTLSKSGELTLPLRYRSVLADTVIEIPKGYEPTFRCIPLRRLIPPSGMLYHCAVILDYLYTTETPIPRDLADDVFLEAMHSIGVGYWTAFALYWSVRFLGGRHWVTPVPQR